MQEESKEALFKVLSVLAVGAVIAGGIVAPGLPIAFAPFLGKKRGPDRGQIRKALQYAKKHRWVTVREGQNGFQLEITEQGRKQYLRMGLDDPLPKGKWDGRWRLVIFDIPNEKKVARDTLRFMLKRLGFHQLQESVWVTPWPCQHHIDLLRELYTVPQHVIMVEAVMIEHDERLRTKFNL